MTMPMHGYAGYGQQVQGLGGMGDMMIESQEIDMSALGNDFSPWLEYLPHDVMGWGDGGGHGTSEGKEDW